jgi:hypothetical protein
VNYCANPRSTIKPSPLDIQTAINGHSIVDHFVQIATVSRNHSKLRRTWPGQSPRRRTLALNTSVSGEAVCKRKRNQIKRISF